MALYDKELILSDAQAITTTANSTNTHDNKGTDLGRGSPTELEFVVTETFTAAGAATLTVTVTTDDNTSFSSATTLWTSSALALATLVAGYRFYVPLPPGVERYVRCTYTVATGPMTAGKITAHLGPPQRDDSAKFYTRFWPAHA
jgi:hypothetical protein